MRWLIGATDREIKRLPAAPTLAVAENNNTIILFVETTFSYGRV